MVLALPWDVRNSVHFMLMALPFGNHRGALQRKGCSNTYGSEKSTVEYRKMLEPERYDCSNPVLSKHFLKISVHV